MILDLKDEYRIITNENNFILQQKRIVQASHMTKEENIGNEIWKPLGYFTSLDYAIKRVPTEIMYQNNDLNIIIDKLNEIEKNIKGIKDLLEIRR